MSHYNKWAGGGYYYSDWWKKKSGKKKDNNEEDKTSSSPSSTSIGTKTTAPSYATGGGSTPYTSGSSAYGGYGGYYDYYDDDEVDYRDIYRSRYKSSLGYSSGKLSSSTMWWSGYGSYGGYSYGSAYASSTSGDEFELLKTFLIKATKEARDLIVILDFPFKVRICYDSSVPVLKDNQKRIFVPTGMLTDKTKTDEEKLGIFCGLAAHEAAHLKYTTKNVIDSFLNKVLTESIREEEKGLIKNFIMMVEDERIEDSLLRERPGYIEFIEKEKTYEYKKFVDRVKADDSQYSQFFLNLYRLIRFPENVDIDILNNYTEVYEGIGNLITPLPESSKEVCITAKKACDLILKAFDVENMSDEEKEEFFTSMKTINNAASYSYETLLYGLDGDLMEAPPSTSVAPNLKDSTTGALLEGLTEGESFCGDSKNTFFSKADGDFTEYQRSLCRVKKYIPAIKKLVAGHDKNYEFNIFGCRSGLLDTNKLAEAYQGVPQVYVRKGKVTTNKTTVCILIDESGSMGYSKMKTARDTAILLNEALKDIKGVDLYIYGQTADIIYSGSTEIRIYREGSSIGYNPHALGSAEARCENRDGVAIKEVALRVRKLTQEPVIMFIISDGSPSAVNYRGYEAMEDTAKKVKEVEKMGIQTIAVTIDSYHGVDRMYPRNIDLSENLEAFPKLLSRYIKDIIVKDKKSVVE